MNSFEDVASQLTQTNQTGLSLVSSLAQQQLILENKVSSLEEEIKETKKDLKKIQEDLLPAAMHENNMKNFTMDDGSIYKDQLEFFTNKPSISTTGVKAEVSAAIPTFSPDTDKPAPQAEKSSSNEMSGDDLPQWGS